MVLSIFYALSPAVGYRKQVFFFFSFSVTTCAVLEIATGVLMVVSNHSRFGENIYVYIYVLGTNKS